MRKSSNVGKMEAGTRRQKTKCTRNEEEKEMVREKKGKMDSERDDESEGLIKQKEGVRESRVSRVGMRRVEKEEGVGCARPGTQSSGRGDV